MSGWSGLVPPTLTNSLVWMTRRSLAWSASDSSLISSMKRVPVWAREKTPSRFSTAPVKEPRTWPKRWLSMRPSGIAVQSSVTSGRSRRGLLWGMGGAGSSLSVPALAAARRVADAEVAGDLPGAERGREVHDPEVYRAVGRLGQLKLVLRADEGRIRPAPCQQPMEVLRDVQRFVEDKGFHRCGSSAPVLAGIDDLVASAFRGLLQVRLRPRQQHGIVVPVARKRHSPHAQGHLAGVAARLAGEGDVLDVSADPFGDAYGVGAFRVEEEDGI